MEVTDLKKNLNYIFIIIVMFALMPVNIFAAGSIKPTTSNLSIKQGGTATFTIKANNATGKVNISSSNTTVATVSASSRWMDNDSFTITVKGVSEGDTTITVTLSDAATYDEEELSGSYSINVKVYSPNSYNTGSVTRPEVKNDATLSKIEISGYDLNFNKNKTNYSLEIPNDVVELNINATPNKATSNVVISGNKNLKVGDNKVKINVTSLDKTTKEYIINVVRKDEIPETVIENLSQTLKNTTKDTIALKIIDNSEISSDVLKQVKEANKNLIINGYDKKNNLLYSWNLNSESIDEKNKYDFGISFASENQNRILELTNYSEMININFNHSGILPNETKIKIYVGDKFEDSEKLNLYYYNKDNEVMESIAKKLNVEEGFVEFELDHCSEYILTRATLHDFTNNINVFFITTIAEGLVIITLLVLFIYKEKINKKGHKNAK